MEEEQEEGHGEREGRERNYRVCILLYCGRYSLI